MLHIVIIHSYRVGVINADNKMITLARIGRIIWIYQIIKGFTYSAENNFQTKLVRKSRVGITPLTR